MVAALPQGTFSPSDSLHDSGADWPSAIVQTPNRSLGELDAASSQQVRTESRNTHIAGHSEFRGRRRLLTRDRPGASAIDKDDAQNTIRCPAAS